MSVKICIFHKNQARTQCDAISGLVRVFDRLHTELAHHSVDSKPTPQHVRRHHRCTAHKTPHEHTCTHIYSLNAGRCARVFVGCPVFVSSTTATAAPTTPPPPTNNYKNSIGTTGPVIISKISTNCRCTSTNHHHHHHHHSSAHNPGSVRAAHCRRHRPSSLPQPLRRRASQLPPIVAVTSIDGMHHPS